LAILYQDCSFLDDPKSLTWEDRLQGYNDTGKKHRDKVGLERRIKNRELVLTTHPYLSSGKNAPCRDLSDAPPVFHYGGKAKFSYRDRSVDMLGKQAGGDHRGLDCSGFVSAALARAGMRIHPKGSNNPAFHHKWLNP